MKNLELNLTKEQVQDDLKKPGWYMSLVDKDWLIFNTAHKEDVTLITRMEKILKNWFHTGRMNASAVNDVLLAFEVWESKKQKTLEKKVENK